MMLHTWDLREQDWGDLGSALKIYSGFPAKNAKLCAGNFQPTEQKGRWQAYKRVGEGKAGTT